MVWFLYITSLATLTASLLVEEELPSGDESDDDEVEKKATPAPLVTIHETFGWPILPTRGDEKLDKLKSIIRAYVTENYSEQSHILFRSLLMKFRTVYQQQERLSPLGFAVS